MKTNQYKLFEYWVERDSLMACCVACDIAQSKMYGVSALAWLAEVRMLRPELVGCVEAAEFWCDYRPLRRALWRALRKTGRTWRQVYVRC